MRRGLCLIVVVVLVISSVGMVWAGRSHRHHDHSAVWWGIGAGVALGTLGGIAASRYPYPSPYPFPPPAYPMPSPPPRTMLYCYNPPGYYPQVPWCPQWWVVPVPY
jgi:hypothetical protein